MTTEHLYAPGDIVDPEFAAAFTGGTHQPPNLIGLSGYARSGKDTVAGILGEYYGYTRVSFADQLRAFLYDHNNIILNYGTGGFPVRLRDEVDRIGWDRAKVLYPEVRKVQQDVGNGAREFFGEDVWVNRVFGNLPDGRVAVSDVRYPNEAQAIKDIGGIVLRVERPGIEPANNHISDTALNDWAFDGRIANDGSVEDLPGTVLLAVEELSL
jgi:hypothetical protein